MISRNIFEVSVLSFANSVNSVENCSVNQFHEISTIHSKIIIFPNCGNKTFFQKFREIICFQSQSQKCICRAMGRSQSDDTIHLYEENEI